LRLFAVACLRRLWPLVGGPLHKVGEELERYADGLAAQCEVRAARDAAHDPAGRSPTLTFMEAAATGYDAAHLAIRTADNASVAAADAATGLPDDPEGSPLLGRVRAAERVGQCRLLRCIFRNPDRP